MGRKIEVERGTFSDVKLVIWDNDGQTQALHLTWDELDAIQAGAEKLRRPSWKATPEMLAELAEEEQEFHDECGHFHLAGPFKTCPETPCGDYRCCIE